MALAALEQKGTSVGINATQQGLIIEYVKVVPRVPRVPHSTDKVVPAKKNQLENFTKNENLLEKRGTGGTGGTEKTRFCSEECKNFDKPSCQAPNWQSLNKKSEIPLGCPGYAYIVEIEEPS